MVLTILSRNRSWRAVSSVSLGSSAGMVSPRIDALIFRYIWSRVDLRAFIFSIWKGFFELSRGEMFLEIVLSRNSALLRAKSIHAWGSSCWVGGNEGSGMDWDRGVAVGDLSLVVLKTRLAGFSLASSSGLSSWGLFW